MTSRSLERVSFARGPEGALRRFARGPEGALRLALLCLVGCASAPPAPVTSVSPPAAAPAPAPTRVVVPPSSLPMGSLQLAGDVAALQAGHPVHYVVTADDLAQLARDLASVHPEAQPQPGAISIGRGVLSDAVEARHRTPSFLIDAEQPEIGALAERAPAKDARAIRTLVQTHMQTRLYGEFWTASRAARTRAGDCSEHAVLVAAVARRLGIPARVVVGYALIGDEQVGFAVGHAWAQLHDGTRWLDVDATPLGDDGKRSYIIAGELLDEGPSYVLALFRAMGMLRATAITVVSDSQP
jgi:transglutaminase-like putative cysteine protease